LQNKKRGYIIKEYPKGVIKKMKNLERYFKKQNSMTSSDIKKEMRRINAVSVEKVAVRILEEIIQPRFCPINGLPGEEYYRIQEDLVALLGNLKLKK